MTTFEMKCYPGTNCEVTLTINIGTMREISPTDQNYDPDNTYGFDIRTDREKVYGHAHHGISDRYRAEAMAMLRAISYGNGGFPLETLLR